MLAAVVRRMHVGQVNAYAAYILLVLLLVLIAGNGIALTIGTARRKRRNTSPGEIHRDWQHYLFSSGRAIDLKEEVQWQTTQQ